ncbi:MAG: BamA/TamA family outer membrane protein [Gemmatimonadaceae bacterium]|nr:BamA/TamA family outer membrane protein [Gemmatimonadaceae bacterium]
MEWTKKGWISGAAAAMLLLPGSLASQAPVGMPAPPPTEVVTLNLKGVKAVRRNELTASIATDASHCVSLILTPLCWITKAHYVYIRKYLNRKELARDILRARVFYWKRGYRDTQVDTLVTPKGKNKVAVSFLVNEGPPTMVTDITVTQSQPILRDREIAHRLVLGENSPLNLIRLDSSLVFLQQSLWDKGYADAIVDTTLQVDTAANTAVVAIRINPRWKATVSDIVVEGNHKIATRTILKSLTLGPGKLFKRSELLRSQRALYESNLFKRAAIEIPRQGDSSKVLIVTVTEAPLRETRLSAGFNTIDFFQVEGRFTNYNFFGRARRLEVQGAVGNLFASTFNGKFIFRDVLSDVRTQHSGYLAPTYNASLNFREPWFGSRANELALGVFAHRRSAPGIYVDRGFGTSVTFTRELVERAPASINYRFEMSRVDAGDVYFCVNYGICDQPTLGALHARQRLSPLTLTGNINRSNDPFSPSRGYRGTISTEHASAFTLSNFRYNRAEGDGAIYHPMRSRGALAGHLHLGWVNPLASTASAVGVEGDGDVLHPRKRFYAGGSRSVRGYGENQLGPRVLTIPASKLREHDPNCGPAADITSCDPNAEGLKRTDFDPRPLGGNVIVEGSAEFRFPVWNQLFGAVFVDAGYVAQRTNPGLPLSKSAITPGFGGRYRSPVGPIRVDIGINPGLGDELPVVTEGVVDGETKLVTLAERRRFTPVRGGFRGAFDRMTLHLSIGEAF